MKIADFFVQITAKGDLKELKALADAQKAVSAMTKKDSIAAKVKVAELKKETEAIKVQAKLEAEKFKITKQEPLIKAKTLNEELKAKIKSMQIAKVEAKEEAKKPKTLKDMLISAIGLNKAFVGIAGSVLLTAIALDRMVTKLAQANQLYSNFQRQTGMPMGRAIGVSGAMANLDVTMTPQDVMQNMQNLQNNLIGVQFGMGNIAPYQMAGISPWGTNSADMIEMLRKQLKRFAPEYRTFLLQQMGLDPRLGALIDLSDTDYLKYKKESLELYLSPQDRKAIQELAPEWNKVNLKFAKSWDKITLMLMRDFEGLATEVGHLVDVFTRVLEIINTIFKPLLDILTMFLKPLYYILDDIVVWLLGGKSILGEMLKGNFLSKKEWRNVWLEMFGLPAKNFVEDGKDVKKLFDIPLFKILSSIPAIGMPMGMMRFFDHLLPNSVTNDRSKNVSMNNDIKVYANSPTEGFSITNALTNTFNPLVAQLQRGY